MATKEIELYINTTWDDGLDGDRDPCPPEPKKRKH